MIGWDEIIHGDLPKDIAIQPWRGADALATSARQGYMGILSHGFYLDLSEPASWHYLVDPIEGEGKKLSEQERARILGGEACMWNELVSAEMIDWRICRVQRL